MTSLRCLPWSAFSATPSRRLLVRTYAPCDRPKSVHHLTFQIGIANAGDLTDDELAVLSAKVTQSSLNPQLAGMLKQQLHSYPI